MAHASWMLVPAEGADRQPTMDRHSLYEAAVQDAEQLCSFLEGLHGGRVVDRVADDVLQVTVDRTLVDTHQLTVEHVLSLTEHLLCLSCARLLGLTSPSVVFSETDKGCDPSLLLQPDELLRELVHGLGND